MKHSRADVLRYAKIAVIFLALMYIYFYYAYIDSRKIDWHDHEFIRYENSRSGHGENGSAVIVADKEEMDANEISYNLQGIYAATNSRISPNRSLPDARLPVCKSKQYFSRLPSVSVVIVFFSENFELLIRCLHSIYNRSPKELLQEIILINDASTDGVLDDPLKQYISEHFDGKVKFSVNFERKGLLASRNDGASMATGQVIVFLDSHVEVTVNWLAPLLEPIKIDYKTATVPMIDSLDPITFEYENLGQGSRGSFDWTLTHKVLKLTDIHQKKPGDNYQLSVMTGNAFAIDRDWFLHLGGYEEPQRGLIVWNDNFEMSFKLHLCGGNLIQVPCSHVAHTKKIATEDREKIYGPDNSAIKLKRVAEVWMDEFKDVFYNQTSDNYADVAAGDISEALKQKQELHCKPFKHFLDEVATDLVERFPPYEHEHFASGSIRSDANISLCVTFLNSNVEPLGLRPCEGEPAHPVDSQYFEYNWYRSIQFPNFEVEVCLDTFQANLMECHYDFGSQLWKYDLNTKQLINYPNDDCISVNDMLDAIELKSCNASDVRQMFTWGTTNTDALKSWETAGRKLHL